MSNHPQDSLNCETTLIGQQVPDCEATIVGDEVSPAKLTPPTKTLSNETSSQTVVTLVNKFLAKAVEKQANYIHIEPEANFLSIRYANTEILQPLIDPLPKKFASAILSQLKLMAELDVNQSQTPQKGRIRKRGGGRVIHFFVQTQPGFYGEKMIIRVVDSAVKPPSLENLIPDVVIGQSLEEIMERSSGLLLVTGTEKQTLTPLLHSLFSENTTNPEAMVTVEDSISYLLPGISQLEIDVDQEQDYPAVLQSLLEEDKSRIMVDHLCNPSVARMVAEMADNERFVLTSLSAENGMSAVTLLREMVTPSLLADTLIGVLHQHSLPRLCPACRTVHEPTVSELAKWGMAEIKNPNNTFYQPRCLNETEREQMRQKGRLCRQCNGEGYDGQIQLFEFYAITPALKTAITQGADTEELRRIAAQEQPSSVISEAISLLKEGVISLREFSQLCPPHPEPSTPSETAIPLPIDVSQRLEKMETLLMTLTQELHQLKQVLKEPSASEPSETTKPLPTPSLNQEVKVTQIHGDLAADLDFAKETIASHAHFYEELQDPGDWEALKRELDPNKETIVTTDVPSEAEMDSNAFKSIPDPWSSE